MINTDSGEMCNRTEVLAFLVEAVFGYLLEYILIHIIFSDYPPGVHSKLPDTLSTVLAQINVVLRAKAIFTCMLIFEKLLH